MPCHRADGYGAGEQQLHLHFASLGRLPMMGYLPFHIRVAGHFNHVEQPATITSRTQDSVVFVGHAVRVRGCVIVVVRVRTRDDVAFWDERVLSDSRYGRMRQWRGIV